MSNGRYRAYPEYKDSGEEWLGAVPRHWKVIQIKYLSPVKRGASPRPIDAARYFDDNGEYAWTRIADVSASDVYLTSAPQRLSDLGSSLSVKLQPGELFLSIAGTVGKPCITGIKACIHDGFVYFPELRIPSKFLFYVFAGEQAYKGLGKFGTQLNLNTDTVGGIKVGCADADEIGQIVRFLDHETAKIDRLIEKQEALIRLLKEKRQAVISHAVTKGLNPHAPLKDSGIAWLGQVPAHWKVTPLRWKSRCNSGSAISSTDVEAERTEEISVPVIGGNGVMGYGRKGNIKHTVLAVGRVGALCGNVHVIFPPAWVTDNALVLDVDAGVFHPEFLAAVLRRRNLNEIASKTAQPLITGTQVSDQRVPTPPLEEQGQIAGYIEVELGAFDALAQEVQCAITLLQERRTALISAAVTGKIDVRHWQPPAVSARSEA